MDRITNDPSERQPPVRVKDVLQETNIILTCETEDGQEYELIVASNRRPIPVPYTEGP